MTTTQTTKTLSLVWKPLPRNPWKLIDEEGKEFKGFPSADAAIKWLSDNGFNFNTETGV